jgi:hypothetical protein
MRTKNNPTIPSPKPRTKQPKAYLSCRVSHLVKDLIRQEWEDNFDSEGLAVEALILRGASLSPKGAERILREAETDPLAQAVKQAVAQQKQQG